jgi:DNA repair photolyase
MSRFVDEKAQDWGKFVYVKTNAVELLDTQLTKMHNKNKTIFMASVTDAWQYVEKNYEITRNILKTFIKHDYPGKITCLTKSDLILRDIDLLTKLQNVEVGLTITSADNDLSRSLEVAAPNVEKRLAALKQLNDAGIKTYAFIAPVLPYLIDNKQATEELFKQIKLAGTNDIYIDLLNTKGYIKVVLDPHMQKQSSDIQEKYKDMQNKAPSVNELRHFLYSLVKKYEFNLLNESKKEK